MSVKDGLDKSTADNEDLTPAANHSSTSISVPIQAPLPETDGIHPLPINESHHHQDLEAKLPSASISSQDYESLKVPKDKRRGLLAKVAIVSEVQEPKHHARKTKWIITFVVAIAGAAAPMGSSIILPGLSDIDREFGSSPTVTNLSVALYMLSMSIFPLWWSSFSETLGRRTIYLTSFFLFLIFNVLSAVSTSIGMFIVMRILSGGAAASVQAVGAGTIADIWEVKERGRAMGYFYLGPLCGPLLSP